jgi:hypothetical protein
MERLEHGAADEGGQRTGKPGFKNCPLGMHTDRNKAKKEKKMRRQAVSCH